MVGDMVYSTHHFSTVLTRISHQYVEKRIMRSGYKVKDLKNPNHGKKLEMALKHVNCYNLRIIKK